MRFICEHCNTRYSIPDDRVAGRVLKIRCKRCRSVVEVMGPPPAGSVQSMVEVAAVNTKVERMESLNARPQLEHRLQGVHLPSQISDVKAALPRQVPQRGPQAGDWWIGLRGKPTGPLSGDELLVYAQRGTLTLRTYAWRPGQGAWQRVDKAPGLGFLREAIQHRQRSTEQPRRLTGMESGVFAASGLFDASALAAVLQQQARPVEAGRAREPSGLTQSLAQEVLPEPDDDTSTQVSAAEPTTAFEQVPPSTPFAGLRNLVVEPAIEARPLPTQTIEIEDSGWFVVDERLQQTLWQRDLPPDLPGTTALITGVHLLPRRRGLKAAVAVLVLGAVFFASALLVAWLTRDSLALALAPAPGTQAQPGDRYSPARALVDRVRHALDPSRGGGVRLPTLASAGVEAASAARPASLRIPRVSGTPVASLGVAWSPVPPAQAQPSPVPQQGTGEAVRPPTDWAPLQPPPPALDLGAPVMADSPEMLLPGELTAEHVARVVQQRLPQLESAYNAALKRNPALAGVVDTSIIIGRDGRVRQVTVQAPGEEEGYLASLLKQRMARWTFPRPSSELEVVLPLRFKAVY